MEAWPGSGLLVWCLLDKQAPGSGGVVDAYGADDASAVPYFVFVHTQTHPDTLAHTHTSPSTNTHVSSRQRFVCKSWVNELFPPMARTR